MAKTQARWWRSELLGTAKTQARLWRSNLLGTAKTQLDGGDRTTPAVEFTTEVSFCETEKKMREGEGEGDGGREE